jgi:hypothetical protein
MVTLFSLGAGPHNDAAAAYFGSLQGGGCGHYRRTANNGGLLGGSGENNIIRSIDLFDECVANQVPDTRRDQTNIFTGRPHAVKS